MLSDIADMTRRALGADAAAVVQTSGEASVVLGSAGLSAGELDDVLGAVAARRPAAPVGVGGFATTVVEEVALPGGPAVAVCALRRLPGRFENAALAAAFARHAAIAVAGSGGPRQDRRSGDGEGAPTLLGLRAVDGLAYEDLTAAVADQLEEATGATKVAIHVWDEPFEILRMVSGSLGAEPEIVASGRSPAMDWESCVARVFATGRPYVTNAAVSDPGVLQDHAAAIGLRRLLVLPLDAGGRRVGVLQVADKAEDFTLADLRAAQALAPGIALALSFTRMSSGIRRRQRVEEILSGAAVAIASGKNLQEFLGGALDELCTAVRSDVVGLVPVSGEPTLFRQTSARPELERIVVAEARGASGLRAYVVPSRRLGDAGWAAVHMPVHANGVRVATLAALRHRGESFDHDERRALSRLANLVALAWATERYQLERAALAREAERQRIGDELHDHTAQLLFAARLRLDAALENRDLPPAAAESAERARSLIVRADEAVRGIIQDLADRHPEGLEGLLVAVVTSVEDEFGQPVQLEIPPAAAAAAGALGRPSADLLAKVAREALVNAAKHAGPCQLALRVALTRRDRLVLAVADDGVGGDRGRSEGHGLASLRRAVRRQGGVLRVRVARTGGTTVTVSLPL
jgi:signal transduction histidine kinase